MKNTRVHAPSSPSQDGLQRKSNRTRTLLLGLAVLIPHLFPASLPSAQAHEGPDHEIEELTERIEKEGESSDLLIRRALEYRLVSRLPEAIADFERALSYSPGSATALRELSRVQFQSGKTNDALSTVSRALKKSHDEPDRASLLMTRAEILLARGENQKALTDADDAIALFKSNVEWYLTRSRIQARLKKHKERLAGIDEGIRETGSGVLEIERIDALIDSGDFPTALKRVEQEMNESRWKASWLIRRAKIYLETGNKDQAKEDLEAALPELNGRLIGTSPDASLLLDRATAQDLLGNDEEAKKDYESARDKGAIDDWIQIRLKRIKEHEDKKKKSEEEDSVKDKDKDGKP